jgi:hypothetical protein
MAKLLEDMDQHKIEQTFAEHDRRMKMFRKSHSSSLKVQLTRRDLVNKLWPLLVLKTLKEKGGTRLPNSPAVWSACASKPILALLILHPDYGKLYQS